MKKKTWLTVAVAGITAIACVIGLMGCAKKGFDPATNISVVAREDGSGTKSAFMEILGLKGKADVSGVIVATGTAGVLAEVAGNPHAIAYESLGYVTEDVKILKVDGVAASVEAIQAGDYKIARPLSIVYKETTVASGAEKAFYDFLSSAAAQEIIAEKGYVSLRNDAPAYTISTGVTGEITVSGSTSLQPLMLVLAERFMSLQNGVSVTVSGGGSGTGYKNAENGVSDFGMISEEFDSKKAPGCVVSTVAKDGIAVIVNKANTCDDVALSVLKNIYDRDAATPVLTWAQVG